jgi:plastocyanin
MYSTRVMFGGGGLLALLLVFASGWNVDRNKSQKGSISIPCGTTTFVVDPAEIHGVKPAAVYACEGDTVEWTPNGHTFDVQFENNMSPFEFGATHFSDSKNKSQPVKKHVNVTVYTFNLVIDGKIADKRDSHVVVGGGN